MLKLIAAALLVSAALATSSVAQENDPQTPEECFDRAGQLEEAAKSTELSEEHRDEAEGLLGRMEVNCAFDNFLEAGALAVEIEALLDGR